MMFLLFLESGRRGVYVSCVVVLVEDCFFFLVWLVVLVW